jgi:MFS family permease
MIAQPTMIAHMNWHHAAVGVKQSRLAVATVFFANGAIFASWASRIPAITAALGMNAAELAFAVFGLSLGAVAGLPLSAILVARYGSVWTVRMALVSYALALAAVASAPNMLILTVTLVALGVGNGLLDVAMNTAAINVERRYPDQIMAGFHALFSAGGLTGALVGAVAAAVGADFRVHLSIAGLVLLCIGLAASMALLPDPVRNGHAQAGAAGNSAPPAQSASGSGQSAYRDGRVLALGLLACCSLLCEGAANDWSAVYIRDGLGGSPAVAALGFTVFTATMTVGRLVADRLAARAGPAVFVSGTALFAGIGFGVSLLGTVPTAGLVGFGLLGLGLAGIVPTLFSAAARGHCAAPAISAVSTIGYLGFLVGPVLIGTIATLSSLRVALVALTVLTAIISASAGVLRHGAPR